ncbi:MAG TPA: MFS transporter [Acidimicrobiia bacterium]|nr:MFS transporter [Acidimicrobiia bacterium]
MNPRRVDQIILHLAVAANTIGLGVIIALLADLQEAYDLPTAGLGLVAGAAFITAFIGYVWLSRYADRGHAKTMLIVGTLVGALALVLAAYARGLWTLVFARAMLGFAEGAFVPAARRVVLDWSPGRPGEVLGRILAASVAGFALGPVIGALLAERFGLRVPFLVPAAVLLLAVPVVTRLRAPEPLPIFEERSFLSLLGNRLVLAGVVFGAIEFATLGSFDAVWARLLTDQGASTLFVGGSFTLMALPLVVFSVRFGRLVDRKSSALVASFGILAVAPAVLAYGWLNLPVALGAAGIVHAVGSSALSPAAAALVAKGSPPDMVARGQGLLEAVGFLAAAAAAVPSGWAYETIGRATWFSLMCFVSVAIFTAGWLLARSRP